MPDVPHPFETKGLGRSPFRFVKLRRGADTCAFCGRPIAWSCHVVDALGREAVVGSDCVRRTGPGGGLLDEVEQELKYQKKIAAVSHHEERRLACWTALEADEGFLADKPHPYAWCKHKTLRDEVMRLMRGTQAEQTKAFKTIETELVLTPAGRRR